MRCTTMCTDSCKSVPPITWRTVESSATSKTERWKQAACACRNILKKRGFCIRKTRPQTQQLMFVKHHSRLETPCFRRTLWGVINEKKLFGGTLFRSVHLISLKVNSFKETILAKGEVLPSVVSFSGSVNIWVIFVIRSQLVNDCLLLHTNSPEFYKSCW